MGRGKRGQWGLGNEIKNEAVDSKHGASRGGSSLLRKTQFQVRGLFFTFINPKNAINIMYMFACLCLNSIFSPLQVKNKSRDIGSEHAFLLGLMAGTVTVTCNRVSRIIIYVDEPEVCEGILLNAKNLQVYLCIYL